MADKNYRDASTGQYTTAEDAAARPGETVSETVPARHESPDVAELRRLAEACPKPGDDPHILGPWWDAGDLARIPVDVPADREFIMAASPTAVLALMDAATERDRLARLLDEPRRSGCAVEIAGVRIAPCDERGQTADMRERDALRAELAHMTEARDNARAEVERLAAMVEAVREACADLEHDCVAGYCDPHEVRPAIESIAAILDEEPQPTEVERLTALWEGVREQVANGALCPMCCTGMTRRTVGMVCQLCGTDYGRADA